MASESLREDLVEMQQEVADLRRAVRFLLDQLEEQTRVEGLSTIWWEIDKVKRHLRTF